MARASPRFYPGGQPVGYKLASFQVAAEFHAFLKYLLTRRERLLDSAPTMKLRSILRGVTAATLMVAVLIAYGFGSFVTFEIEHHHHADGDHHHAGQEHLLVHHDDASHDASHDAPLSMPDGEQENDDDPAGSHSHSFSMGVDGPFVCASGCAASLPAEIKNSPDVQIGAHCPDDPSYDLIKPPQLG